MTDNEHNEILTKARDGDAAALATLCEAYYRPLLTFMTYRVDDMSAEDLTNDVFLRVMKNIHRQHGRFEPWLYRIARNLIIDRERRRNASPEVELDDMTEKRMKQPGNVASKLTARMDVQHGLGQLSPAHRELLTLKFIRGLTNREIGDITGQKLGAIRAMQLRALNALRDVLEREDT